MISKGRNPTLRQSFILKVLVMTSGILKSFTEVCYILNIKPSCCRLLDLAFKDWDWSFDDVDDVDGDDDDDDVFDF